MQTHRQTLLHDGASAVGKIPMLITSKITMQDCQIPCPQGPMGHNALVIPRCQHKPASWHRADGILVCEVHKTSNGSVPKCWRVGRVFCNNAPRTGRLNCECHAGIQTYGGGRAAMPLNPKPTPRQYGGAHPMPPLRNSSPKLRNPMHETPKPNV